MLKARATMASVLIAVAAVGSSSVARPVEALDSGDCKPSVDLWDAQFHPVVAGVEGWDYEETASGDLNGDGVAETVHVLAQAPADAPETGWDDSQPWQVFVEDRGERIYVFAQRIQLGGLDAAITPEGLLLRSDAGSSVADYLVTYRSPGQFEMHEEMRHEVVSSTPGRWRG